MNGPCLSFVAAVQEEALWMFMNCSTKTFVLPNVQELILLAARPISVGVSIRFVQRLHLLQDRQASVAPQFVE